MLDITETPKLGQNTFLRSVSLQRADAGPVSYTHLTLPTMYCV